MSKPNKWAIITGASSGIGRALAMEFAAGGFNVMLTGRDQVALSKTAAECASRHSVLTEILAADLSRPESIDGLVTALASKALPYEALVNNAGFGIYGDFADTDIATEVDLLNVQLTAALKLTKAILPGMISRHSGRILNVASVYSYAPVPSQSVYSACKAFLLSFSASLRNELSGSGVTVTVFCPGITQTKFRSRAGIDEKQKGAGMTAQAAAHIAYTETLRGTPVVIPGFVNRCFVLLASILPSAFFTGVVRYINRRRF